MFTMPHSPLEIQAQTGPKDICGITITKTMGMMIVLVPKGLVASRSALHLRSLVLMSSSLG
jgi:hypothetical protein